MHMPPSALTAESGFPGLPICFLHQVWIPQKLTILEDALPAKKLSPEVWYCSTWSTTAGVEQNLIVLDQGGYPWYLRTQLFGGEQIYPTSIYKNRFRTSCGFTWGRIKGQLLLFVTTFRSECSLWKHFCFYVNILFPPCRLLKKKLDFGETLVLGWLASTDLILST